MNGESHQPMAAAPADVPESGPAGVANASPTSDATAADRPPVPEELEDTGLPATFLSDLILKTLYRAGARSGRALEESLRIPFYILDDLLLDLQQRYLLEVRRTEGHGRQGYYFDLTGEGRDRAREALASTRYVGPAPVPFDDYVRRVKAQSVRYRAVSPEDMREILSHLVLEEDFIDSLGAAVNAGSSIFLYGNPGNGKTAMANAIAEFSGDPIYVPHAVAVEGGTVIQMFDPVYHRPVREEDPGDEEDDSLLRSPPSHDQRFVLVERPSVVVGGELTMDDLDLQFDAQAGVHRAPVQLKANGGVFVIDDFGRQRIRPRDLLNRWMVPLEHDVDYLSLPTGHKLPVPFDTLLVFATNLDPLDLVEEAFLRRLRYKVEARDPTREHYEEIFRRCCEAVGMECDTAAVDQIYRRYYERLDVSPRAVHPRDLVSHIVEEARYRDETPELNRDTIERACRTYFLNMPGGDGDGGEEPIREG